jgi:hypothetical protein
VAPAAPAVFPARRLDDSGNDMLWNQQWILAFTFEARKKGKNSIGLLRICQEETKALFKNNSVQNKLITFRNSSGIIV